jgi:dTDP-4-amino-4,6-dideoxygalactose transaminase
MIQTAVKSVMHEPIEFIDLHAQRRRLGDKIDQAIAKVLEHGRFIMGPEVPELERQLADFCGARHAIGCSSGTDAIVLGLMALGVGPGDAVFVPSFTFAATAEAVAFLRATPVFVDIRPESFNMDPDSLSAAIDMIAESGELRPVGVIAVDLFGQPADYRIIEPLAERHGMWVMADGAQSFGATLDNRRVGAIGRISTTSFFPAKPLGCYGDGGAIFTNDDELATILRSLLFHGKGSEKYDNVRIGMNGRLDTIQAAILLEKLSIFEEEIERRQTVAQRYNDSLGNVTRVPCVTDGTKSAWAQYTIVLSDRDAVASRLKQEGIPTAVYYPRPLHRQTAYRGYPTAPGGLLVSEDMSMRVLSLPMHPYLEPPVQQRIVAAVLSALKD